MKLKILFLLLLSFFSGQALMAQIENASEKESFKERIYFGGGFDMAFDQYRGILGVSPSAAYMITNTTSLGLGITYQYYFERTSSLTTDIYGYRFFLRQNIVGPFFAYTEYENLSYEVSYIYDYGRYWTDSFYLGAGYFQPISSKIGFIATALYNLKNRDYMGSPWTFRAGFTFNPFSR